MLLKCLVWYLVCAVCVITAVPVEAGFSPSHMVSAPSFGDGDDTAKIQAAFERRLIERRLQDYGFSTSEITSRLDQLPDWQIHRVASSLGQLKVGQDGEGVLIGVLIIILIIGVILPLLGVRVWR